MAYDKSQGYPRSNNNTQVDRGIVVHKMMDPTYSNTHAMFEVNKSGHTLRGNLALVVNLVVDRNLFLEEF